MKAAKTTNLVDKIMSTDEGMAFHNGNDVPERYRDSLAPGSLIRTINVWAGRGGNERHQVHETTQLVHCDVYAWKRVTDALGDGQVHLYTVNRNAETHEYWQHVWCNVCFKNEHVMSNMHFTDGEEWTCDACTKDRTDAKHALDTLAQVV